jgi:hypothetical protein
MTKCGAFEGTIPEFAFHDRGKALIRIVASKPRSNLRFSKYKVKK